MKPSAPMLAPKQRPLKPATPLQPKNAQKTASFRPQRRCRFQLGLGLREQRRWRFQPHAQTSEQRRQGFHARDFQCPRAIAGPGRTTSRRAEPHISDQAPPVWRAPEGPEGTGGLRDRPLRAVRLACGDLAGGRARRRPEHQRSHKQQAQSQIPAAAAVGCGRARRRQGLAAVPVGGGGAWPDNEPTRRAELAARTASGRAAAHGHTEQPGPQDSTCGARNTSGATSTAEQKSLRTPRSTPGSGRPGGHRGGQAH